jgi:hypothetical protein
VAKNLWGIIDRMETQQIRYFLAASQLDFPHFRLRDIESGRLDLEN